MPRHPLLLLLALAALCPALRANDTPESLKAQLVAAENAFCDMASREGVAKAFEHFAAPDAALFGVDPRSHRGPAAARLQLKDWPAHATLVWTPLTVDVSPDGSLGYTWGRYTFTQAPAQKDASPTSRGGFYLTVWKRQPDGSWRFVADMGSPDKPAR